MKADGLRVPISIPVYRNFRFTHPVIRRSSTINANRGVPLDSIALPGNFDGLKCVFHCQLLTVLKCYWQRWLPWFSHPNKATISRKNKQTKKQTKTVDHIQFIYTGIYAHLYKIRKSVTNTCNTCSNCFQ